MIHQDNFFLVDDFLYGHHLSLLCVNIVEKIGANHQNLVVNQDISLVDGALYSPYLSAQECKCLRI